MEAHDMPGLKKAAILLLTIDEELSKEIIKELEEEDIREALAYAAAKRDDRVIELSLSK